MDALSDVVIDKCLLSSLFLVFLLPGWETFIIERPDLWVAAMISALLIST